MSPTFRSLLLFVPLFGTASLLAQGPLAPNGDPTNPIVGPIPALDGSNAPQPTMKTLHQVEPRTPIEVTATPADPSYDYTISLPGSYYLTRTLFTFKTNSILIDSDGVTLDLNGFSIIRFAVAGAGIEIAETAHRCTIRNGSINGFRFGVNRILGTGEATGGSFQDLTVTGHSNIGLLIGNDCTFNPRGFDIDTTTNLVIQNSSRGSSTENYNIVADNRVGPIVIPFNSGAITGTGSGQAAGVNTTDPWANFSY